MRFVFKERKAAESAAHLLRMADGRMPYMKLIKLLYLADRQSLIETGFPITGDRMVSMPYGPVLSGVLDTLNHGPRQPEAHPWFDFISAPQGYDVLLQQDPPEAGELSDFEIDVLKGVFDKFGHMDQWALSDLTHDLPEWHDPQGSSLPIEPTDILRSAGIPETEIKAMVEDAEHMWFVDRRIPA